ncbi:conserved hypothetical protein [Roseibium sp. TrichSKD4]|nr:conserved hypothetical protein [Roseibium sp. TrichSKD4]
MLEALANTWQQLHGELGSKIKAPSVTRSEFNQFCASLSATTNVIQWGNASVWKVGGKIFAICSAWGDDIEDKVAFKCSGLSYSLLSDQEGFRPAPYLARAKWIQVTKPEALTDDELRDYISAAHKIISAKLTRKQRADLGLIV